MVSLVLRLGIYGNMKTHISQSRYENDAPTKALTFNEMNIKSIKKQASTISYKCELNVSVSYTYLILLKMLVVLILLY